jgi:hypothetical protein
MRAVRCLPSVGEVGRKIPFPLPTVEGKGPPCCKSNVSFRCGCCEQVFCLVLNYCLFGFVTAPCSVPVMAIQLGNIMICVVSQCYVGLVI